MIKPGDTYQHYKGNTYKILAIARHSENPDEMMVVYQAQYNCPTFGQNPVWTRPLSMFCQNVLLDGIEFPRFRKIEQF